MKSLFKGCKFQYIITNQPQHIKYKQYKPIVEGMQAQYKYSLHTCPSERVQCHILLKYPLLYLKLTSWSVHEKQTVGVENSILKSRDIKNIHIT